MDFLKIKLNISQPNNSAWYCAEEASSESLANFGYLFLGWPSLLEIIDYLEEYEHFSINALNFSKLENDIIQISFIYDEEEERERDSFFIEKENFIEVIKTFENLRNVRCPEIIIEQDPETKKVTCRGAESN